MNPAYYVRTADGLNVVRIAQDDITLLENDFDHSEWPLDASVLSTQVVERVNLFCAANGVSLNWSAMAQRRY
jgi:hypothetical protein